MCASARGFATEVNTVNVGRFAGFTALLSQVVDDCKPQVEAGALEEVSECPQRQCFGSSSGSGANK